MTIDNLTLSIKDIFLGPENPLSYSADELLTYEKGQSLDEGYIGSFESVLY